MIIARIEHPELPPLCRLLGNFRFRSEEEWPFAIILSDGARLPFVIPKHFECDLYSVPRFFQRLVPKSQISDVPAWLHDYAYGTGGFRMLPSDQPFMTRAMIDKDILLRSMKAYNFPAWHQFAIYQPVRLGGGKAFQNCLDNHASITTPLLGRL